MDQRQRQMMPFGWPIAPLVPPGLAPSIIPFCPPSLDDRDLVINSNILGPPGPQGEPGPQGKTGVGVASAEVTDNPGDLLLLLTDGTLINAGQVVGPQGVPGATGATGATGAQGIPGSCKSCGCNTTTIKEDYCATETDCYIGAQLKDKAIVTLPYNVPDGTSYTIKLEYGAPVGNRKLTVQPEAPALINGVTAITMTTPYESVSVLYNNQNWYTI